MNTNAKKYYLTLDIGGTTFTIGLFNNKLEQVLISKESHINDYLDKISLIIYFTCINFSKI